MKPSMMMKALPSRECEKYRYNLLYSNIFSYLYKYKLHVLLLE